MSYALPPISGHQMLSPDDADQLAKAAARSVLAGETPPELGLRYLSELLYVVPVPEQVAATYIKKSGWSPRGQQSLKDLAWSLRTLMSRKILPEKPTEVSKVEWDRLVNASFCSWVRSFLSTSAASQARNIGVECRSAPAESLSVAAPSGPIVAKTVDDPEGEMFLVAADKVDQSRKNQNRDKLGTHARCLQLVYDFPDTDRPTQDLAGAILDELDQDPKAALRAVSMLARGKATDSLASIPFAGWSCDDLANLAERDPQVAQLLARAAASAMPPLPTRTISLLRRRFADALGVKTPLPRQEAEVFAAWLATSTTMVGETAATLEAKSDEQIADEQAVFVREATLLLRSRRCPWRTPRQLARWLRRCADDIATDVSPRKPKPRIDQG